MFEDEKVNYIESLPEADSILVIWIKLLTMAGKCNSNGFIFLTEQIPYSDDMLAHKFNKPINTVKLALSMLEKLQMIKIDNEGYININNWEKHQNIEGLEKIREQNRIRQARYRENQKALPSNVTDDVTVTDGNGTDIDIEEDKELDIDKDIDKENIIIMTDDEAKFINILSKIPNYPLDREKDLEMYKTMEERYPTLNLVEAIEDWRQYKLDKPLTAKSNSRSQINTSFKNYAKWGKCLKKAGEQNGEYRRDNGTTKTEADRLKELAIKEGLLNKDGTIKGELGEIDF
jgi:predicted phage replisome organizer